MKRLITLFSALAFVSLPAIGFSQQQPQQQATATQNSKPKPSNLKNLPPAVQGMLAAGLANINLSTPKGQTQLNAFIVALALRNPSYVAEITYAAVASVSQSLISTPQQAGSVTGSLTASVVKAFPGQALNIVVASVSAVPNSLNVAVIPAVVTSTQAAFPNPSDLVTMLNAVNNIAQDRAVTQALRSTFATATGDPDSIAFEGEVEEDGEADFTESPFALVTAPGAETTNSGLNSNTSPFLSGDQGVGTVGAQFPSGSSGGSGSGSPPSS